MRFEKIWIEQRRATRAIKRRFEAKDALDYLVGEKLRMFAKAATADAAFARELPRFLAAIWRVFNEFELAGYVARQKPAMRKELRALLHLSGHYGPPAIERSLTAACEALKSDQLSDADWIFIQ
jgi:hypothetical protein